MSSIGYNGNSLLKKKNVQISWTPELMEEYIKCSNDIEYFAEKYIQIVHVDHGLIPIQLYGYQKEIIQASIDSRNVVVNTSRQAGKTTTATILILHYAIFNDHKTIALLANKGDAAREILDRIKIAYESLPSWLQHGVIEWNKGSVEFENGSKIIAAATSSSAIRGKSVSFLYIDETAHVENWDEFFASVFPTISSGQTTKVLLTSTPNGLNHFYKTCMSAKEKTNGYSYIEVPWTLVPGRDEKWKEETLAAMNFDIDKFNQEFNGEFIGSSGTLISGSTLKNLHYVNPISDKEGLKIYEKVDPKSTYIMICDVSRGKGLDYSAFNVIDISQMPYRQVAVFRDNYLTPVEYCEVIHRIAIQFNQAMVLIEINDIGGQVADLLYFDYEYENIISTENAGRSGKRISSGFGKNIDMGIRTTKSVKSIGCSVFKLLIEQNQLILQDFDTITELSTFSKKASSFEAEPGCHDDLVMTLVLFSWITTQTYFKEMTDINTMKYLRKRNNEELLDDILPFGFIEDGNEKIEEEIIHIDRGDNAWLAA